MTDPHTVKFLNPALYEAYDKLKSHADHFARVNKEVGYATRAYFNWGPLSSITIANEHNMWKAISWCHFLTGYEKDILYCWFRAEPRRIMEAKDDGRKEDKPDAAR